MTPKPTGGEDRSTDDYLDPRREQGFGSEDACRAGAEATNAQAAARREEIGRLLKEHLDGHVDPSHAPVIGSTADKIKGKTRVQAALTVLDDALCERTKTGRVTDQAMRAARMVMEHRFGRPRQSVEIESSTDEQLLQKYDRRLLALAKAIGVEFPGTGENGHAG